jgi:hypothetical protein
VTPGGVLGLQWCTGYSTGIGWNLLLSLMMCSALPYILVPGCLSWFVMTVSYPDLAAVVGGRNATAASGLVASGFSDLLAVRALELVGIPVLSITLYHVVRACN